MFPMETQSTCPPWEERHAGLCEHVGTGTVPFSCLSGAGERRQCQLPARAMTPTGLLPLCSAFVTF